MVNHPNRSKRDKIEKVRRQLENIRDRLPPEAAGLRPQRGIPPEEVEELRSRICAAITLLPFTKRP